MAGELRVGSGTGSIIYAQIVNTISRRWNGSSFESYSSMNYLHYVIPEVEQGTSGIFVGDFPVAISDAGDYEVFHYIQIGSSPAEGDPVAGTSSVFWNGAGITTGSDLSSGEMAGSAWLTYILRTFKRTDKNDEVFDATNAAIAEIRRRIQTSRDEKETTVTDTISTLGEYKMDVATDLGMFVSDIYIRDPGNGRFLTRISKARFDQRYGIWGAANSERGIPHEYCVFGGQILIGPVPNSIDYEYVQSYTRANLTPVTVASTSIPYTTEDYKEILRDGVLWRLYKQVENDDQAAQYRALWLGDPIGGGGMVDIEKKERKNRQGVIVSPYLDL